MGDDPANAMGAMYSPYPWKAAYCGDINLIGDRRPVTYWREMIWGFRTAPYIAVQPPVHYGEENIVPSGASQMHTEAGTIKIISARELS